MLPLWPTLLVRFPEANIVEMVQGSQFTGAEELAKHSAGAEVHVWATVPELRAAVLRRMAPAIRTAAEILAVSGDTDRMLGYVDERWRELTPEVFTAGLLAITGRIPGVEIRHADGGDARASESFGVEMLAAAQARVWLRLTLDWSERKPPFAWTLAQDLGRYVSLDADLRTAAAWLNRFLKSFPDTLSPRDRYLLEALRAYVSYAAKVANEFADRWAGLFVAFDLQAGDGEDARALRFSDGLARATVTRTSVARTVAEILPHADKDVVEALDAICRRMGEDTLVEDVFFDSFRADADTEELLAAFRLSVETGPDVLFAARPIRAGLRATGRARRLRAAARRGAPEVSGRNRRAAGGLRGVGRRVLQGAARTGRVSGARRRSGPGLGVWARHRAPRCALDGAVERLAPAEAVR